MYSIDINGKKIDLREAVFPILKIVDGNRYELIGTGFYIGNNALFATARHVIEDVLDGDSSQELKTIHFTSDGKYVVRDLDIYTIHSQADVAAGLLMGIMFNDSKKILGNNHLALSERWPVVGETLVTYAYPKTTISYEEIQKIDVIPTVYEGVVLEVFPEGRDSIMLPSACYCVEMEIAGGASGGPVFDEYGLVVAINSTSYDGNNITFVSCAKDLLDLDISENIEGERATYVRDYIINII